MDVTGGVLIIGRGAWPKPPGGPCAWLKFAYGEANVHTLKQSFAEYEWSQVHGVWFVPADQAAIEAFFGKAKFTRVIQSSAVLGQYRSTLFPDAPGRGDSAFADDLRARWQQFTRDAGQRYQGAATPQVDPEVFRRKHATPDDYRLLYVLESAPLVVIKAAFRALAALHHPDAGGDPEAFKGLNAAYQRVEKAKAGQ